MPKPPTTRSGETVTAVVLGNRTRLDRPVAALTSVLECPVREYGPGGELGYRESTGVVQFHDRDRLGRFVFATGLLPRVRAELGSLGFTLRVVDRRLELIGRPDARGHPRCASCASRRESCERASAR